MKLKILGRRSLGEVSQRRKTLPAKKNPSLRLRWHFVETSTTNSSPWVDEPLLSFSFHSSLQQVFKNFHLSLQVFKNFHLSLQVFKNLNLSLQDFKPFISFSAMLWMPLVWSVTAVAGCFSVTSTSSKSSSITRH